MQLPKNIHRLIQIRRNLIIIKRHSIQDLGIRISTADLLTHVLDSQKHEGKGLVGGDLGREHASVHTHSHDKK